MSNTSGTDLVPHYPLLRVDSTPMPRRKKNRSQLASASSYFDDIPNPVVDGTPVIDGTRVVEECGRALMYTSIVCRPEHCHLSTEVCAHCHFTSHTHKHALNAIYPYMRQCLTTGDALASLP